MITIKNILTELCERGCMIEIKSGYPIDHLPKSLVTMNDNIIDPRDTHAIIEFKINSMVNDFYVYFIKHKSGIYESTWCMLFNSEYTNYFTHYFDCSNDYNNVTTKQLDFLTHYLYTRGDNRQQTLYVMRRALLLRQYVCPDAIIPYRENLKLKMIESLINDGILTFSQAIGNILPIEIKLIIINMVMKLDNWYNVGLYMKY